MTNKPTVFNYADHQRALERIRSLEAMCRKAEAEIPKWTPIDDRLPETDEEGYSEYILLSFSNMTLVCIGQYREDDEGGAFYAGDDDETLISIGLHVNAWMPLPKPYREDGEA